MCRPLNDQQLCYTTSRRREHWSVHAQVDGQPLTFMSPSGVSLYLKRLTHPALKTDNGWTSVKYRGKPLEHYKEALDQRRSDCAPCLLNLLSLLAQNSMLFVPVSMLWERCSAAAGRSVQAQ